MEKFYFAIFGRTKVLAITLRATLNQRALRAVVIIIIIIIQEVDTFVWVIHQAQKKGSSKEKRYASNE